MTRELHNVIALDAYLLRADISNDQMLPPFALFETTRPVRKKISHNRVQPPHKKIFGEAWWAGQQVRAFECAG